MGSHDGAMGSHADDKAKAEAAKSGDATGDPPTF